MKIKLDPEIEQLIKNSEMLSFTANDKNMELTMVFNQKFSRGGGMVKYVDDISYPPNINGNTELPIKNYPFCFIVLSKFLRIKDNNEIIITDKNKKEISNFAKLFVSESAKLNHNNLVEEVKTLIIPEHKKRVKERGR